MLSLGASTYLSFGYAALLSIVFLPRSLTISRLSQRYRTVLDVCRVEICEKKMNSNQPESNSQANSVLPVKLAAQHRFTSTEADSSSITVVWDDPRCYSKPGKLETRERCETAARELVSLLWSKGRYTAIRRVIIWYVVCLSIFFFVQ